MSRTFQTFASCSPSAKEDSYIYKIVPCANDSICGITSSDELFLVNSAALGSAPVARLASPPSQLTSLVSANNGQVLVCAGGEDVHLYDARSHKKVGALKAGESL